MVDLGQTRVFDRIVDSAQIRKSKRISKNRPYYLRTERGNGVKMRGRVAPFFAKCRSYSLHFAGLVGQTGTNCNDMAVHKEE